MLIDTFINAIFLYDDKMVITFNYKEGTKTITFAELQEAISNKNGSDLDCLAAPTPQILRNLRSFSFYVFVDNEASVIQKSQTLLVYLLRAISTLLY